jgi:hypothetical protein
MAADAINVYRITEMYQLIDYEQWESTHKGKDVETTVPVRGIVLHLLC